MPDISIVIKSTDRFSDAMKTMKDSTKAFSKDIDGMQIRLNALNKTKASLKVDTDRARSDLRAAEKQFSSTGDAVDKLILDSKQLTFENARRNLSLVTKEAANVEKQMLKTGDALSKTGNRASGGFSAAKSIVTAIAANGIGQMVGNLAMNLGTTVAGSALGSNGGTLVSSALSSAVSGAALGTAVLPGIGTAIGAALGSAVGAANGAIQNYEKKDDAFKSYVQEQYEDQMSARSDTLSNGSTIAGSREQTQLAFAQRFGSDQAAIEYLDKVKTMAQTTNYTYDEITGYSKKLLNSYKPDQVFGVLKTLSDASAGLDLSSSDVDMFISGLSRMRTTGKATQEYLNYFSERGVDVYQALSDSTGAKKSNIADMVTNGDISGDTAAQAIVDYINKTFGGLSEKLSTTYDAMVDNLQDMQSNVDAAMGEGYNEERKKGVQAQMDYLSGSGGKAQEEANKALGAWQASLENSKEAAIRDAVKTAMSSNEYRSAQATGDAAKMGEIIARAQVQGLNEYNSSEGAQLELESQKALIGSIRDDTSLNSDYYDAGYELGNQFTLGRAAGMSGRNGLAVGNVGDWAAGDVYNDATGEWEHYSSHAYGLDYVPYDNFPVLLHEGERVETAVEARSKKSSPKVVITGNSYTIREEADVRKIALEMLQQMELAGMRG